MTLTVLSAVVLLTTITAAQANQCPGGGACASNDESPNVVVSMLQTKLQINVPGSAAEEASSDAFSGETNLDEKALNVSTLHDPHAMLTELEDIAHSGETPAFDVVSQIKSLIEYEMKPGLANMRNLTTQDTLDFSDTIQLCNDQSKAKEDAIEADMQVVVNDARSLHAACRVSEKAMYEHNLTNDDSYCVELGKFLHDAAQLTLHIPPNARTRDASVQYVEQAGDTNMCRGSEVRGLADGCTAQEEGLRSKSDDCNTKQGSFEVDFCMWKTQLEANCETLDTCHATAVTAYDKHVAKTRTLMQKWDAESASLEKILCYCNAWLSKIDAADNRSQHNSTQFDVCKNESYTPLPVNYGTRPEKAVCLLTSVAKFPGTSGFITQEYNSFLDFVKAAVPCPQATTAAPTTAMPTTTQAASTTTTTTAAPTTKMPTTWAQIGTGQCSSKGVGIATIYKYEGTADACRELCASKLACIGYAYEQSARCHLFGASFSDLEAQSGDLLNNGWTAHSSSSSCNEGCVVDGVTGSAGWGTCYPKLQAR